MRMFTACCLLLGVMLAAPAQAASNVLARVGQWEAYHTVANDGGQICGILQFNNGLGLLIKMNQARQAFVHLSNDGWVVPKNARMEVSFVVDGAQVARLPFTATNLPSMIEGNLAPEQAAMLLDRFALGRQMTIHFLTGDEGAWNVPLRGTYQIAQAFFRCLSTSLRSRQPFGASAQQPQSQPF